MTKQYGEVSWVVQSTPFGEQEPLVNNADNPLCFPGQYADLETGYSCNDFRDYDPSLGRYIQRDPIGLLGGVNTLGYVLGNPVGYVDVLAVYYACSIKEGDDFIPKSDSAVAKLSKHLPNKILGHDGLVNGDGNGKITPPVEKW